MNQNQSLGFNETFHLIAGLWLWFLLNIFFSAYADIPHCYQKKYTLPMNTEIYIAKTGPSLSMQYTLNLQRRISTKELISIISDPYIFFQNFRNDLNDSKGPEHIHCTVVMYRETFKRHHKALTPALEK